MPIHPSNLKNTAHRDDLQAEIYERRRRMIDADSNVLMGAMHICRYLKVSSFNTLMRWHESYGLPMMKTADGKWMTTTTAIDQWIWLASELEAENRLDVQQRQTIRRIAGISSDTEVKKPYKSSQIERAIQSGHDPNDVILESKLRKYANNWPQRAESARGREANTEAASSEDSQNA